MSESILKQKALKFAIRIVNLCKFLTEDKKEFSISKQIIRSGTSIGANVNEAYYGQSRADFVSKMQIALKEAAETEYWITLLFETDYIEGKSADSLLLDCVELKKLLTASINTAKSTNNK